MAIAVNPDKIVRYVLERDQKLPKEKQTIFLLRVLKAKELADIKDSMSVVLPTGRVIVHRETAVLKTLALGVTGWENFKGEDGNNVQFIAGAEINWDYLEPDDRIELSNVIHGYARVTEQEEKNLK